MEQRTTKLFLETAKLLPIPTKLNFPRIWKQKEFLVFAFCFLLRVFALCCLSFSLIPQKLQFYSYDQFRVASASCCWALWQGFWGDLWRKTLKYKQGFWDNFCEFLKPSLENSGIFINHFNGSIAHSNLSTCTLIFKFNKLIGPTFGNNSYFELSAL